MRAWLGFLALGAGLIHLALVLGSPPATAVPLVAVGAAEFAWGVAVFTAPRVPLPRIARIAAVVPLVAWVLVLLLTAGSPIPGLRVLPMLLASLLDVTIAIVITVLLRRGTRDRPLPAGRYLLAVAAGAVVVALVTMPALAATEAGGGTIPDLPLPGLHGH